MSFNKLYLPKSDVVFTVMFLNKELCEKTLNAILEEKIELIDIVAESKNDLHQAALNSIYFDIKTRTTDGRIITLDLQGQYLKNRVRNRTIYYACREIASQKVTKGKYENLKSVIVSFILTGAPMNLAISNTKIMLQDIKTNQVYSDLLTIHEVNMKRISASNGENMWILRVFFEIDSEYSYNSFVTYYGNTEVGKLLIKNYNFAINNISLLDTLKEEEKYMYRLSEEERLEERQEGKIEGKIEIAKNAFKMGLSIEQIKELTGLSEEEISNLK